MPELSVSVSGSGLAAMTAALIARSVIEIIFMLDRMSFSCLIGYYDSGFAVCDGATEQYLACLHILHQLLTLFLV